MIVLLGDLHNSVGIGIAIAAKAREYQAGLVPVIQVGDLEWNPRRPPLAPPWPIHFVEGNHDHLPSLMVHSEPTEVAPHWIYCPRGSSLTIDGRRVGFLGGARSIDRAWRREGVSWWPEEEPTVADAERLLGQDVDLLVTHSPPRSVVEQMGYRPDQQERASMVVEDLWVSVGRPSLVCGHMHQRYRSGTVLVLGDRTSKYCEH